MIDELWIWEIIIIMDKATVYYFVGIKGSGMSSLALILHDKGYQVEGSDIEQYTFTQKGLAAAGIKMLPFSEDNIREGLTVIAGNSFTDDHPEIKRRVKWGCPFIVIMNFLEN